MIALLVLSASVGVLVLAVVAACTGRVRYAAFSGMCAIATGLASYASIMVGSLPSAVLNGAMAAMGLYQWWHGGGGDGTRRLLREFRRRFVGIRRTAPQAT